MLRQAEAMLQEGATILDIGGYSTRPEAPEVTPEEERVRVIPAIRALRQAFPDCLISIDTFRALLAEEAVAELEGKLADPEFQKNFAEIPGVVAKLDAAKAKVARLYARWEELEAVA